MSAFRAVLLALLVVGTGVVVFATGATADDVPTATAEATLDATAAQNESANGSSLGADISSFMQSSAAEADGAVETGMWSAAYDATENRSVRVELVERRTDDLRSDVAELRDRRQELANAHEAGELSDAAYRARVGRILGQINALDAALDATETRAREVNASVENVTALRGQTEELAGPEIAAVARNLSGVGAGERGPPLGVSNGTGPGDGNGVGDGGPSDPGNGSGVGNANGSGPGNGNDGAGNRGSDASTDAATSDGVDTENGGNPGNGEANAGNGDDANRGIGEANAGNGDAAGQSNGRNDADNADGGNATTGTPGEPPGNAG
mgnify:CR=1 FL=1